MSNTTFPESPRKLDFPAGSPSKPYNELQEQELFRAQVSIERLFYHYWSRPREGVLPRIEGFVNGFNARSWALISLVESTGKTVLATLAYLVTSCARSHFKASAYKEAIGTNWASLGFSAIAILSPNIALKASVEIIEEKTSHTYFYRSSIGREDGTVIAWGDIGDLKKISFWKKLQIIGDASCLTNLDEELPLL